MYSRGQAIQMHELKAILPLESREF